MATRSLDDKRIFVIFLSISFAVSTLIPGLYSFLPEKVQSVLCSPMVMGVGILLITTLLGKIGTKRQTEFTTGTDIEDVKDVNVRIARICEEWCTEKDFVQKLQISMDAIMEGFYEHNPNTKLNFKIWYDQLQIKLDVKSENIELTEKDWAEENFTTLSVSLMMLRNMFDNVKISQVDKSVLIHLDADI